MSGARIAYTARPDATPVGERETLASIYAFVLQSHQERQTATLSNPEERHRVYRMMVGKKAAWYALQRLRSNGLIRNVDSGGKGQAAKYVLLTQTGVINNRVNDMTSFGVNTQKIRNPGQTYGTIGKRNAHIIDYVHSLGRAVTLNELANKLEARKNYLKKRNTGLLLEVGLLVEVAHETYVTPPDIKERLEEELEASGCNKAEQLQRQNYAIEREAWRRRKAGAKTNVLILHTKGETPNNAEELVKNIPAKSHDGIIHHTAQCACWLCEHDAPEYVEIETLKVA